MVGMCLLRGALASTFCIWLVRNWTSRPIQASVQPPARATQNSHTFRSTKEFGRLREPSDKILGSGTPYQFDQARQDCDAGVTQNLPILPKLTSLTVGGHKSRPSPKRGVSNGGRRPPSYPGR